MYVSIADSAKFGASERPRILTYQFSPATFASVISAITARETFPSSKAPKEEAIPKYGSPSAYFFSPVVSLRANVA